MYIFIVQHGDALPSEVDPERPLSEKGRSQVTRMIEFLKHFPVTPDLIFHSTKKRALETAQMISTVLGGIEMQTRTDLNPNDSPDTVCEELNSVDRNVMIVGHMPFLQKLAVKLISPGSEGGNTIVEMSNASPLIIVKRGSTFIIDSYIKNQYLQ
jgi:phosphohistidine phosphatase